MTQATYIGTGHRKNSIARVRLTPGSGKILINGIQAESYLQFSPNYLQVSKSPLSSLGLEAKYDLNIKAELPLNSMSHVGLIQIMNTVLSPITCVLKILSSDNTISYLVVSPGIHLFLNAVMSVIRS